MLRDRIRSGTITVAVALSVGLLVPFGAHADLAVLEPVPRDDIAALLDRNFTLPLVLDESGASDDARGAVIAAEVARLTALLVSRGFLEARIETSGAGTREDPLRLKPVTGPLYRLGRIRIDGPASRADAAVGSAMEALAAGRKGAPLLRSLVDDLVAAILYEMRQASHAHAALRDVTFETDARTGIADLILSIDPGLPMRFGTVRFQGSLRIDQTQAQRFVPFGPGDAYSLDAMDALRRALEESGEFRRIRIETAAMADMPGVIDVAVRLWDRPLLPSDAGQPHFLLAAILVLAGTRIARMTPVWGDSRVRLLSTGLVVLAVSGSALEVTGRLSRLLYH